MEVAGAIEFDAPGGRFRLTARADRIDELVGGGIAVIDFKTGAPPTKREVQAGFAPQLPLEAAMVAQGGFSGVPAKPVEELAFWRLSGGREPGQVRDAADDPALVAAEALADRTRADLDDARDMIEQLEDGLDAPLEDDLADYIDGLLDIPGVSAPARP